MNKRILKITSFILLSCTILTISNICFLNANVIYEKTEKLQYKETLETATQINERLINKIQTLQALAVSYITDTSSTLTATELCMQYIRKDKYSTGLWSILLGTIDSNFITYVNTAAPELTITTSDKLIDLTTLKEIDFIHMIAVLNTYYKENALKEYAGWAGDLITLLDEVATYKKDNSITDINILSNYTNSLLGTNNNSSFSSADALADIDGITINEIETLNTDFTKTLRDYYINNSGTNNSKTRFKTAQENLGTKEAIITKATSLLNNTMFRNQILSGSTNTFTAEDINVLATEFAEYIYEKPYIELKETTGTINVGEEKEIDIIEKHMENATYETNNQIATAKISNYKLYITPIEQGTTTIKITKGTTSANYNITVNNLPPSITTDILLTDELIAGVNKTISFAATGTNNVYTWYISSERDKDYTKLAETNIPTLELTPTKEMNDKYLKCGIKNKGNEEIFTTPILLKVANKEIVNTSDTTPIIAIMTIITVLIANILQILISKNKIQKENI